MNDENKISDIARQAASSIFQKDNAVETDVFSQKHFDALAAVVQQACERFSDERVKEACKGMIARLAEAQIEHREQLEKCDERVNALERSMILLGKDIVERDASVAKFMRDVAQRDQRIAELEAVLLETRSYNLGSKIPLEWYIDQAQAQPPTATPERK